MSVGACIGMPPVTCGTGRRRRLIPGVSSQPTLETVNWQFNSRILAISSGRAKIVRPVRAENLVHGSDQEVCGLGRSAVMITAHVSAVRVRPGHAGRRGAAAVAARAGVEGSGNPDPAPSARCPAATAAGPGEAQLGGPGPSRSPARRDTETTPPGPAAACQPGHDAALAPRHRRRRRWAAGSARGRTGRPATRRTIKALVRRLARENPGRGIPQDPRRNGRPRS